MPTVTKPAPTGKGGGVAFGVTSLVTGIIALLSGWVPFFSLPLGAIAIVFGILGLNKPDSKGMAIAGLVMGIVGAITGLAIVVFWLIALSTASSTPTYYFY